MLKESRFVQDISYLSVHKAAMLIFRNDGILSTARTEFEANVARKEKVFL